MTETAEITDTTGEYLKLSQELKDAKAEIKRMKAELSKAQASAQVAAFVFGANGDPEDVKDIAGRIERAGWFMEDGRPTMPGSNVGPSEWAKELRAKAGHLFGSQAAPQPYAPPGTTAQQPGVGGDLLPGEPNPFADATWNDTAQAQIILADRARADRLAAAAGTTVGALPAHLRRKSV